MNIFFLIILFFISFEVKSATSNVVKLSCEYDPALIKKTKK